ncbi:MAG: sensor histidine kinase [Anaerolineae bacterium]
MKSDDVEVGRGAAQLELESLRQVVRTVSRCATPLTLLEEGLETLLGLGAVGAGWAFLPNEVGGLTQVVYRGRSFPWQARGESLALAAFQGRQTLAVPLQAGGTPWSLAAAPMLFREEPVGVLVAAGPAEVGEAAERFVRWVEEVALLLGVGLGSLRLEERLQARQKERDAFLRRLIRSQEDERRRIARDLHDETSQALLTLSLRIDALRDRGMLESEAAQAEFNRLKQSVYDALAEVHRIIFNLRPTILDDMGLVPAVMWMAEQHLQRRGIEVSLEVNGQQRRLPEPVETTAFRVAQEAIQNIQRHARATSAHLALTFRPGALEILVMDDGQGFDVKQVQPWPGGAKGLGLLGMQERVALVRGSFQITSQPGRGTSLRITIPLTEGLAMNGEGRDGSDSSFAGG